MGGLIMSATINWKKIKNYIVAVLVPVVLGAIVGFVTSMFMDYDMLKKPVLSPPGAVFPIVWSIL